eukprot:TRINITY_DN8812_c0_g1_i1.p1 TRINITY_DN8812_c0_g1~~TRINITY_DN8812_c0_g1_i1.p1  ORF type:complete len:788 (+),score=166.04 TRINITY_DN8812_c0_g1_i1:127-2490(+)
MGNALSCGSDNCSQYCQGKYAPQVNFINHSNNSSYGEPFRSLAAAKIFEDVPEPLLVSLAEAAQLQEYKPGQEIIRQGDDGHEFFLIKSGEASVNIDGSIVATLRAGDYFGEQSLLRNATRNATVTAATSLSALRITREQFKSFGLHQILKFKARQAVQGGTEDVKTLPPSQKMPAERDLIAKALRNNANLTSLVGLTDEQVNLLIDAAWKQSVYKGTVLIKQGDTVADYLYVVQEGMFDVTVHTQGHSLEETESKVECVAAVPSGGSFGELALLYSAARAATVRARVDSVVWVIDRKSFKIVLAKANDAVIQRYMMYLEKVKILENLQQEEKRALAQALNEMHFRRGETIIDQGAPGDLLYILVEGEVQVIKDGVRQSTLSASEVHASIFGERALLTNEPRAATIQVLSECARTLTLDRQSCDMLLGPISAFVSKTKGDGNSRIRTPTPASLTPTGRGSCQRFGIIHKKDLKAIGLLGCGGFGAVELVEHAKTSETYALKALNKGHIVKCRLKNAVIQEKNVQLACDSAFIIKLFETYSDPQTLYLLLELALGGELYATYLRRSFHGSEKHARFYAGGVVNAFDHMHDRKILYRDLKPENLLLTDAGHVKVTDMGLAKVVVGKTFTTCGTPDYFAPEMINSKGHTVSVDWWTLGILIYEFINGSPPFESPTHQQTFKKISAGIEKVKFSSQVKGAAEDLVRKLLVKNPPQRLPMLQGGSNRIKNHEWYRGWDWRAFESLQMPPPYVPQVSSKRDLANFAARDADRPPAIKYEDDMSGWDNGFATSI